MAKWFKATMLKGDGFGYEKGREVYVAEWGYNSDFTRNWCVFNGDPQGSWKVYEGDAEIKAHVRSVRNGSGMPLAADQAMVEQSMHSAMHRPIILGARA
jgi:hypothetical protein